MYMTKNSYFKIRLCTDQGIIWGLSITSETLDTFLKRFYFLTTITIFELQTKTRQEIIKSTLHKSHTGQKTV